MSSASAVFSMRDGRTPLEVEMISMSAGITGAGEIGKEAGKTDGESCQNCVDLSTGALEKGADALNMEATVAAGVGAAGVGTVGILWLAALSG